jgi:hypothetical protein
MERLLTAKNKFQLRTLITLLTVTGLGSIFPNSSTNIAKYYPPKDEPADQRGGGRRDAKQDQIAPGIAYTMPESKEV